MKTSKLSQVEFNVTTTPQSVYDIIKTQNADFESKGMDACQVCPIDGDLNYLRDGNIPSATLGIPLGAGMRADFEGASLKDIQLCAKSGTVKVVLQVGFTRGV